MKPHNKAFGQAIRERRKGKNQSHEALAFAAGFDRAYISLLELSRQSPTLDTMHAKLVCQAGLPSHGRF